jgi:hypothetical protein
MLSAKRLMRIKAALPANHHSAVGQQEIGDEGGGCDDA